MKWERDLMDVDGSVVFQFIYFDMYISVACFAIFSCV